MSLADLTWQRTSGDNWRFGTMVRGLVRNVVAEVYFDKDSDDPSGGWIWFTWNGQQSGPRGMAQSLTVAVSMAEDAIKV